jgi:hypothetical protein
MVKNSIAVSVLLVLLQGCSTPFAEFYHDNTGDVDLSKAPAVELPTGKPQLFRGNHPEQDTLRMLEDNYRLIGYSSFNAGDVNESDAIAQAKKISAAVVILYSQYTGSVSGSMPLTLPDTTTSSTSMLGSAYGPGGYASYSGTAYTTTYGTKTTYIPYTVHRSDYLATYWIKMKRPIFGVHIQELTPEIKKQIGSNKGVLIQAVIKGSPAFDADILKDDVLKQIGDIEVFDGDSYQKALSKYEGKEADVFIIRGDNEIHKSVRLRTKY